MHGKAVVTALGAALALSANMARADVLLATELSNFGYRLIDLRPEDGVAPSLQLDGNHFDLRVDVGSDACSRPWCVGRSSWAAKGGQFREGDRIVRSVADPAAEGRFSISGALAERSLDIAFEGAAHNSRSDPLLTSRAGWYAWRAYEAVLTVAPYTQVLWSGTLALDVALTLGRRGARVEAGNVGIYVALQDGQGRQLDGASRALRVDSGTVGRASDRLDFELSFANAAAQSRQLRVAAALEGTGVSFQPVPEPGGWTLMLCGLGLLGGMAGARRRGGRGARGPCRQAKAVSAAGLVPALAALGAAAVCAPARADITALARFDDFGYRLVDLRPHDGIAPALRFVNGGATYVDVAAFEPARPFNLEDFENLYDGRTSFQPMDVHVRTPAVQATGRLSGGVGPGRSDYDMLASGSLASRAGEGVERAFRAYLSPAVYEYGWDYEVTPFTRVVFSGLLTLDVRRTVASSPTFLQVARAGLHFQFVNSDNSTETRERNVELTYGTQRRMHLAGRQTFVHENRTGAPGRGHLDIDLGVEGRVFKVLDPRAAVSAVPEPASMVLLPCGLGVVAGVAWRARRRGGAGHGARVPRRAGG